MSERRHSFLPLLKAYYSQAYQHARAPESPLLADGIDTMSIEPACWQYPEGEAVPMSNFASQQNFIRGLVAMGQLTGESEYVRDAEQVTRFFLSNYVDDASGLFHWGGHRFIGWQNGKIEGPASKECVHELKHHFPYYDFLHQVDAEVTEDFLQGFWAAHVSDWQKLDLSRHGEYGEPYDKAIFSRHTPGTVVDPALWPSLPETVGLTFVNASTDLIYAACHYYKYSGDKDALRWAKHLYHQFVLARNPVTGMPVYQFSSPLQRQPIPDDDTITFSWFGDRAKRQFGEEFGDVAKEANALFRDCWPVVVDNPLAILECYRLTGDKELLQWAVDGIKAYFAHAWDESSNEIIPMWNDGTDLTGFEFKKHGYYGPAGTVLQRQPADPAYLLTLVRASGSSDDQALRVLTAKMFKRFALGELEASSLHLREVATETELASPYLVFALLDLHQLNGDERLLRLAQQVGLNLVAQNYHRGWFVPSKQHRYARLDDPTPYALVAIEAAYNGCYSEIPPAISTGGYLHGDQLLDGQLKTVYDYEVIYNQYL